MTLDMLFNVFAPQFFYVKKSIIHILCYIKSINIHSTDFKTFRHLVVS